MKIKLIIIFTLLMVNTVVLFFVPRFGWTLRDTNPFTPYKYQGQYKKDNKTVVIYKSSNNTLEIGYSNKISRILEIQIDNDEIYTVKINIDGGINDTPTSQLNTFVFSDIIWKDSSGIFMYRYILIILAMLGYSVCILKNKSKFMIHYILIALLLFTLSILLSFRIIT